MKKPFESSLSNLQRQRSFINLGHSMTCVSVSVRVRVRVRVSGSVSVSVRVSGSVRSHSFLLCFRSFGISDPLALSGGFRGALDRTST